jgi:hypothetical protein
MTREDWIELGILVAGGIAAYVACRLTVNFLSGLVAPQLPVLACPPMPAPAAAAPAP